MSQPFAAICSTKEGLSALRDMRSRMEAERVLLAARMRHDAQRTASIDEYLREIAKVDWMFPLILEAEP